MCVIKNKTIVLQKQRYLFKQIPALNEKKFDRKDRK